MNEVTIKSIRKMERSEYENESKYSMSVEDNHNYFIDGGVLSKNSIVIIDETQNIDIHTFKTIITRIGSNSKMIFLGDIEQVDRRGNDSCLKEVFKKFKEADFVGTVEFDAIECVRNPIIPKVLDILDKKVA
jgi:phosphate starvation-inducible protein PhoH